MRALWLVGMMGSGKTTVGETVVRRLGLVFIDTDSHIESENQRSIAVIWETEGENAFRDLESELLVRLGSTGQDCVVATGGGVVLRPGNIAVMRETGTVVWLTAEPGELVGRVSGSPSRPLLREVKAKTGCVNWQPNGRQPIRKLPTTGSTPVPGA